MTRIFRGDHLSPSLSKLAFPELIQRFLPATWYGGREAIVPQTDRQRGLEASFEQRFARAFDIGVGAPNPMERSAFSPAGGAPYLILNLTRVDTGADYVVSPLDLREVADVTPYFRVFHGEDDYRLSTMAATSARFPIISPVGIVFSPLDDCPDDMCRFVDGGYFDNSGIEALASVVRTMRTWDGAGARPPRRIVVLHIDSNPLLNAREEAWRPDLDVHELEAVLTAREQRVQMAYLLLNRMTSNNEICGWTQLALRRDTRVPLRLGWILSPSAADEIDRQAAALLPTRLGGEYNVTSYCRS